VDPQFPLLGKIHSVESMGTLDGPGIRFVVFFAGCPLRCRYCHNIDLASGKEHIEMSVEDLVKQIIKNKPYFEFSGGGVTLSGGEPFFQPEFLIGLLTALKANGLHTVVDTSLHAPQKFIEAAAPLTDLFMVSLKHFDDATHQSLTGASNRLVLKNIRLLDRLGSHIRFRFLVLPGITDTPANLAALIEFLQTVRFDEIELLAYHRMGVYKWEALGLDYKLKDTPPPTKEQMQKVKTLIEQAGFSVRMGE
jgi:pyruvate formate lyase activating enzyme